MSASANLAVLQSVPQRSDKEILSALNVTCSLAYRMLRQDKYRQAAQLAQEALRLMPRRLRRTGIGAELRIVAFSAGAMYDWLYGDARHKRQQRKTRKARRAKAQVVPFTPATAHLLLVPDRTEPEVQS
jgi:hypothetical protein